MALAGIGLLVGGAGILGPALAPVTLTGTDAGRLRESLSVQGLGTVVCRYDVNGNGAEDLLVVYRSGWWRDAAKPPPPGGVWSAESVTVAEKGVIIGAYTLNTLDTVVKLRTETLTGQAENVYLRMFDELYEVPISSVADCRGSLDSYTYRMCLMKGFFTRERTQSFPTLPSCPGEGKKDAVDSP